MSLQRCHRLPHARQECHISRQYLYQASSFVCGVCLLALPAVQGFSGYVLFAWLYGIFYGGYQYSLKMCTYEKVRARNFAKTWGFVQGSQALPMVIGVPVTGEGMAVEYCHQGRSHVSR